VFKPTHNIAPAVPPRLAPNSARSDIDCAPAGLDQILSEEFVLAPKLVEEGRLGPARRRSSWAGAMGLVQFLPSDLYRYGVDGDRDDDVDIWTSVPDALASAANQLKEKGWRSGIRWGHRFAQLSRRIACLPW
jgi:membrane-bound lytic murein transglycosylase B